MPVVGAWPLLLPARYVLVARVVLVLERGEPCVPAHRGARLSVSGLSVLPGRAVTVLWNCTPTGFWGFVVVISISGEVLIHPRKVEYIRLSARAVLCAAEMCLAGCVERQFPGLG